MADIPEPKRIVLWGTNSVGKTTALAAYVVSKPDWMARDEGSQDDRRDLREKWNRLLRNQLLPGTAEPREYIFNRRDGGRVSFRDMRGDGSHSDAAEDRLAAYNADGILMFVDLEYASRAENIIAIESALDEISCPFALVLTKCEACLSREEFELFVAQATAARFVGDGRIPHALVSRFGAGTVFPITVYGWHNKRPAQYLDDFGQYVPFNIHPEHVTRPFNFIMGRLGQAPR